MKKFSINCQFGGQNAPFTVYIGEPKKDQHPLHFQADWLAKERGGNIPPEVMASLSKLMELAAKNNVPFEDLCTYALEAAQAPGQQQVADYNKAVDQHNSQSTPKTPESGS
jgi:hypothetical protein